MIAEFSIVPIGAGESLSPYVAECLKIVKASGLKHKLTATCTLIEGDYDEVMDVISDCHKRSARCLTVFLTIIRTMTERRERCNGKKGKEVEEKVS